MNEPNAKGSGWRDLAWPLAVYVIALFPFCATSLFFYPDERFYLDASLTMYQSGDVMVPRFDDGSPRLNKPVLAYWIMLASYHVFGVHLVAARLPFFLAGAAVLCLTHRLGLLLSANRKIARLSVWIMLSNPLFWGSCMRCLPDVLLALFALMSVLGYFALLTRQRKPAIAGWLLFGGLGLAIACKGLPGFLLLGCFGVHAYWRRREQPLPYTAKLVMPMIGGMFIGVAGFLPILWNHAGETATEMWRDQFVTRLVGKTWGNVYRLPLLLLTLAGLHLAWLLLCLFQWGRGIFRVRPRTSWEKFLALTSLLWFGATAATENCSARYLFPLFPWFAVTLATATTQCNAGLLERYSRHFVGVAAAFFFCVLLIAGVVSMQIDMRAATLGAAARLGAGAVAALVWSRRQSAWRRLTVASAFCPAALLAGFLAVAPLLLPDLGAQARQSLVTVPAAKDTVMVMGSACQTSRVRLALAPQRTEVQRAGSVEPHAAVVLMSQAQTDCLPADEHDFYPAAHLLEHVSLRDALDALVRGELAAFLRSQVTPYYWVVTKDRTQL